MSTATVLSFQGAEHCDWQDITFLRLGFDRDHQYVRDVDREFGDLLAGTYDDRASLPPDARDLGYTRDGRELWLVEGSAAYLVRVDDANPRLVVGTCVRAIRLAPCHRSCPPAISSSSSTSG